MRSIAQDISLSAISAGFIAVLVGFASSVAIVFQAAHAAGASESMISGWILALGLGMGITCIGFSYYYRAPVITAWSTPGAAMLAVSLHGVALADAIGAFIFAGILTVIIGLTGHFDRLMRRLPLPIVSAMLAGVLFNFGLHIFGALKVNPLLVGTMLAGYLLSKRCWPRYTIIVVLAVGLLVCFGLQDYQLDHLTWHSPSLIWVTPQFHWPTLIGIGIPLFIVTMTAQNIPGMAILRASGYQRVPVSTLITGTGVTSILLAPFGGFAINLAAITAAICTEQESHSDRKKRYIAGLSAGVWYLVAGLAATTVVTLFTQLPAALISALAGLALLGTIANSLAGTTADSTYRDSAIITLLVTISGIQIGGIASPLWGLLAGITTQLIITGRKG